ncbi:MAG: FHA domain-containing protein [Chloracidobacterium sp.]|uniref:FHA domain-containing protein n=1 Tax=Chloracidobacterium validum TaxID=2821543 RepID=A0ABX8BAQ6_9BACT|nr:FHA domain-containing protein [Chloracidobacterium validum]QUW04012.1 FHA domain-containing protein [Chloracidobacterium validum]
MVIGLEAVFLSGLRKGESVKLTAFPATIGRDPNSSLPLALQDQLASTRHAQIVHEGSSYLLRDVGSSNGTYHNGSRITEVRLKHADVIEFGVGGPKVRFDFIEQPEARLAPGAAVDRFEAATLAPSPAMAPNPSDVTISRKSTVPSDVVSPQSPPAVSTDAETVLDKQPYPPLPPPPPTPPPFASEATVAQVAQATPRNYEPPPVNAPGYDMPGYDAQVSMAPSVVPSPPQTSGKSNLVLFIVIGAVGLLFLLIVGAIAAYFLFLQ